MSKCLAKSKQKKGFTLVEVIVVLVILAILAALLVPKLTGWIDQAKEKAVAGEGHLVLSAAQAYVSEQYALGNIKSGSSYKFDQTNKQIQAYLAGDAPGTFSGQYSENGKVTTFWYKSQDGKHTIYYDSKNSTFTENDPSAP